MNLCSPTLIQCRLLFSVAWLASSGPDCLGSSLQSRSSLHDDAPLPTLGQFLKTQFAGCPRFMCLPLAFLCNTAFVYIFKPVFKAANQRQNSSAFDVLLHAGTVCVIFQSSCSPEFGDGPSMQVPHHSIHCPFILIPHTDICLQLIQAYQQ